MRSIHEAWKMKKEHLDITRDTRETLHCDSLSSLWSYLLKEWDDIYYLRWLSCRVLSCPSQARTMRRGANTAGKKWSLMKQNTISDTEVSSLKCLQGVKSSHFPLALTECHNKTLNTFQRVRQGSKEMWTSFSMKTLKMTRRRICCSAIKTRQ